MDNIHRSTPCFYKPFNTKSLFFTKKKETAIQYMMTYAILKVDRIYKRHDQLSPGKNISTVLYFPRTKLLHLKVINHAFWKEVGRTVGTSYWQLQLIKQKCLTMLYINRAEGGAWSTKARFTSVSFEFMPHTTFKIYIFFI